MMPLTEQQAYAAAFFFLEEFWKRAKSDDVGMLLRSMALLPDGSPADPGVASEWQRALEDAINQGKAPGLELE